MLNQVDRYTEDRDESLAEFEAELTRLALAADPDEPVPQDALPFEPAKAGSGGELLPDWYMPAPTGRAGTAHGYAPDLDSSGSALPPTLWTVR